jgi:DNA-binding beta-propeller fold protein YncE
VNVTGQNFQYFASTNGTRLSCVFGSEETPAVSVSSDGTQLVCVTPRHVSGKVSIKVKSHWSGTAVELTGSKFNFIQTLFIADTANDNILRFGLINGTFLDVFIRAGYGGMKRPWGMRFGPDKNFFVSNEGTSSVLKFHGQTGAFLRDFCFVRGSPRGLTFHYDDLYVVSARDGAVYRFNGYTGSPKGVFAGTGLSMPWNIMFERSTNLSYISNEGSHEIVRYKPPVHGFDEISAAGVSASPSPPLTASVECRSTVSCGENAWRGRFDMVWSRQSVPHVRSFDFTGDSVFATSTEPPSILQFNRTTGHYITHLKDNFLTRPTDIKVHGSLLFVCSDESIRVYHRTTQEFLYTHLKYKGMRCGTMTWHQNWDLQRGHD